MAPRRPVRFGVIGCGTIAYWTHLRILPRLAGVKVVAIADPSEVALARARRLVDARGYEDAAGLLSSADVDAVVIAAPTPDHASLAMAACRASKHVYVEKPLATSVQDARRVVAAAEASGVEAVVGFQRRLHPSYQRVRALVAAGAIGRVRGVQSVFGEPAPADGLPVWKRRRATGGGVLLDLAVHHIDLLRWILGQEPTVVACSLESVATEHDGALVHLRTEEGVEIQSMFSFRSGPADAIEFYGERGTLRVDRHQARIEVRVPRRFGYGTRRRAVPWSIRDLGWRLRRVARPSLDPSPCRTLRAFVRRLERLGGGADDLAGLADGVRAAEVVAEIEARAGLVAGTAG